MPTRGGTDSDVGLGGYLAALRKAAGLSLREVEQLTEGKVSNAYISQLENGRVASPSPNILHKLASAYGVPYRRLMEKAGYLLPTEEPTSESRAGRLPTFALTDLTEEEEHELIRYLAFLRSRKENR